MEMKAIGLPVGNDNFLHSSTTRTSLVPLEMIYLKDWQIQRKVDHHTAQEGRVLIISNTK